MPQRSGTKENHSSTGGIVKDLYLILLVLFSVALAGAAVFAGRSRKPIGKEVGRLLLTTLLPIAGNILLLIAHNGEVAQAAYFVFLLGTDIMFLYLIRFTVAYCNFWGRSFWVYRTMQVLTVLDGVQLALNPVFKHAYRIAESPLPDGDVYYHILSGQGHIAHLLLSAVYLAIVVTTLLARIHRTPKAYVERYVIVLVSIIMTTAWQVICIFAHGQLDTSMIGYAVCGLLIFYFSLCYKPAILLWYMMRAIVSNLNNGIMFFDLDGKCIYANESARRFADARDELQLEEKIPLLQKIFSLSREDLMQEFEKDIAIDAGWKKRAQEEEIHGEEIRHREEGDCDCGEDDFHRDDRLYYHVEYHILTDRHGARSGVFFSIQDRTAEERKSRWECYRASHDMMTGLYNRDGFCEKVREILTRTQKETGSIDEVRGRYLILSTNIRNFKMVNELFGKESGDRILQEFVSMLKRYAREDSVLARLSGDRFAVFCRSEGFDQNSMEEGLHTVTHLLGDQSFPIITHVGIYEVTEPELAVTLMIDRATMAASSIRGEYNQRIAYYDNNLRSSLLWEQKVIGELEQAIRENQIVPYLQAQVNREGQMEGAEVLVRWQHPKKGLIPPGMFLPVLERNGQIALVDRCIWEKACQILARWKAEGRDNLYLSINISPKDFYFMDVYETITSLVEKYQISPKNLRLEITETVVMDDMEKRLPLIENLRKYGFLLEMDDFGSGYSSLNMLKDIPVDVLKIDMVFLYKTKNPEKARKILQMIIAMTEQLGIGSITEGVETQDQAGMLLGMGCHMFQGYYFSKPIPLDEFEEKYLVA